MPKLYEALAEAFRAEDVDTQFGQRIHHGPRLHPAGDRVSE